MANISSSGVMRGLSRLLSQTGLRVPQRLSPFKELGTRGVPIFGGYVQTQEQNRKWVGREKYRQASDIATNISIVAASIHYFLNLIAHPKWSFIPPKGHEKDKKALELAEFMQSVIADLVTPWPRIVRQAGMYRFHGFCTLEWTAKKRADGKAGLDNIETRPQHTIERWDVDDLGTVNGVWQRSPQTQQLIGIPRNKLLYLVEDTLTDSPEGLGLFRHLAEPYDRLRQYLKLEARGFERDLRGTPVGRAPLALLNRLVQEGTIKAEDAKAAVAELQKLVEAQVKESDTGLTLDSAVYESQAADGLKVSGVKQWDLELLTGGTSGLMELARAVDRIQREMARLLGTEQLMMGGESQGGSRALSEDKSRNLYLIANSVLSNIAAGVNADIIPRIWALNSFPEELMPQAKTEDVAFKSVEEVTSALSKMAMAGAVLAPDDPVVNDVRDLLGVEHAPEPSKEMMGAHYEPKTQQLEFAQQGQEHAQELRQQDREHAASLEDSSAEVGKRLDELGAVIFEKYSPDQKRYPKGNAKGGQFAPLKEGEAAEFVREGGLLHGTSSAYLKSIMKEGLKPHGGLGADYWLIQHHPEKALLLAAKTGPRPASVFATRDLNHARDFAVLAARNTKAQPILLKIKAPKEALSAFKVDEVGTTEDFGRDPQYAHMVRFEGAIKPEWIVGVAKDTEGEVVYLVVIPNVLPEELGATPLPQLQKVYDPNQPRDKDGKWSAIGAEARASQDEAAGHLKDFAKMIAGMQEKNAHGQHKTLPAKLIAENGRTYYFDQNSFQGNADTTHKCYMCATQKVWEDPDLTYVEGYMSVHGVPVEHAWAVDKAGKVIDPTIQNGSGVKAYFGVPIKRQYLDETAERTRYYGVFGHRNRALYGHDPQDIVEKRYDPEQPRYPKGDPKGGQWRAEDAIATALYEKTREGDVTPEEFMQRLSPGQRQELQAVEDELAANTPTNALVSQGGFKNPDGTWTPERQALHAQILNDMFNPQAVKAATPGANELPTLVMLGGRAGAGKTSSMARFGMPFDPDRFLNVSADLIQEKLPGYTPRLAGLYNQEAQEIAAQAEGLARQSRLNVLFDATMKTPGSAIERIAQYRNAGYRVEGYFVHTSPTVSSQRAISRFQKTGRYVPPSYILNSTTNERTFDLLRPSLDKWALYDNNSANDPRLVAQGGR